eukprot:tig00001466_g8783.t1
MRAQKFFGIRVQVSAALRGERWRVLEGNAVCGFSFLFWKPKESGDQDQDQQEQLVFMDTIKVDDVITKAFNDQQASALKTLCSAVLQKLDQMRRALARVERKVDAILSVLIFGGCRPIGPSVMVTRAEGNVIHAVGEEPRGLSAGLRLELEGSVPPLDFVKDVVQRLPVDERVLVQRSLFVGVCADPFVERPEAADFLRLQFFVRDAAAASAELIERLDEFTASPASEGLGQPLGALMVACMGRGEGLYGFRGHDSQLLRRALGPVPVCGFFANGEIGPVRGGATTHLHGYTTAIALIY